MEQVEAPELKMGDAEGAQILGWGDSTRGSPEGEGKKEGAVGGNMRSLEL